MLTIAYLTCREEPCFEWFYDSLKRECAGDTKDIKVIRVDLHAPCVSLDSTLEPPIMTVHPKPSVWQGKHRLTSRDYFAASNARNTALCYAQDGWIAYVDDLSVLLPGWLKCVRQAMAENYIVLGAYRKVYELMVENGEITSFKDHSRGWDTRWGRGNDSGPVPANGGWMFGCSLAAPVEAFLKINGWDEDCDSLGSEDYIAGMMLERAGYAMKYDRRMVTFESEERHRDIGTLTRFDKGKSPNDKSHKILELVKHGRNRAPNYFGEEGIAGLRQKILRGEPFPIPGIPQHDWFDGQPLAEL